MGREQWDSAADWNGGGDADQPGPRPGPGTRKTVDVICCPQCGGHNVGKRDWCTGDIMAIWQCRGCQRRWKEPMEVGQGKAILP